MTGRVEFKANRGAKTLALPGGSHVTEPRELRMEGKMEEQKLWGIPLANDQNDRIIFGFVA